MSLLHTATIATILPALAGCSLFGSTPGPERVQEFTAAVEQVQAQAELARELSGAAVQALRNVTARDLGADASTAYEQLMTAIEESEDQAEELADAVATMHGASDPVFDHWESDVEGITDPSLRQRGTVRLQAARERYRAIIEAIDPAVLAHRSLNQNLRDHALFLGHDLSPASIADARPGIEVATQNGRALQAGIETALTAARAYLQGSSSTDTPATPDF